MSASSAAGESAAARPDAVQAEHGDRLRRQARRLVAADEGAATVGEAIAAELDPERLLERLGCAAQMQDAARRVRAGLGESAAARKGAQRLKIGGIGAAVLPVLPARASAAAAATPPPRAGRPGGGAARA